MDQMIKDLSECKQYLKHDFKIHLEEKTDIKDHCMTFSLNDKDLHFKNECCDHQHLSGCLKCLQLSDLLEEIMKRVQLLESENIEDLYDEILFKTSNAIDDIVEWKKHLVRSKIKPEIKDISFWSDNAGCYKSTLTLAMIYANLGPILSSYFSEAQDGKGACDRKASHIKAEIKRYVNEGLNVLDANDMKKVSITACPYGLMLGTTIGADF
ncbi:unnamed protein product [Mytilus coruscus]|uniref:Uncharacterized protein n=1 Tax=Mytilus coruscus TaxID=42192 RepID=A0A6J8EDN4_MYTCO|nr:unnamed protein product [Mytilus coruscus]